MPWARLPVLVATRGVRREPPSDPVRVTTRRGPSPTLVGGGGGGGSGDGQVDEARGGIDTDARLRRRVGAVVAAAAAAVARRPAAAPAHVAQQLAVGGPPALRHEPQPGEALAEVLGQHAVQDRVDDRVEQREQQAGDEVVRPQEEVGVLRVPAPVHVDQAHDRRDRQPHHQHDQHVDQQHANHVRVLPVPELLVPCLQRRRRRRRALLPGKLAGGCAG